MFNSDKEEWEDDTILTTNISNIDGSAIVIIPDYPQITSLSIKLTQIKLSINIKETATISKSLRKVMSRLTRSVLRYMVRKTYKNAKKRLACEYWYEHDDGANNIGRILPPCPCTSLQMSGDTRYKLETPFQFIVSRVFFQKSQAIKCYREKGLGYVINKELVYIVCII